MFPRVLAPNAALREQVIQSAGPSPALFERLTRAASCMGIHDEGTENDAVEVRAGTGVPKPPDQTESPRPMEKPRRASYLWAMLIARIYSGLCSPSFAGAKRSHCFAHAVVIT